MPTYEYRCEKCGLEFEEFQRITAPALKTCPKCKGKVKRIISGGSGFILKGSGFYVNDYPSKSRKSSKTLDTQKAEETAKTEGKKAATEKKESKPKSD